jgi:hypothetical protein
MTILCPAEVMNITPAERTGPPLAQALCSERRSAILASWRKTVRNYFLLGNTLLGTEHQHADLAVKNGVAYPASRDIQAIFEAGCFVGCRTKKSRTDSWPGERVPSSRRCCSAMVWGVCRGVL